MINIVENNSKINDNFMIGDEVSVHLHGDTLKAQICGADNSGQYFLIHYLDKVPGYVVRSLLEDLVSESNRTFNIGKTFFSTPVSITHREYVRNM